MHNFALYNFLFKLVLLNCTIIVDGVRGLPPAD